MPVSFDMPEKSPTFDANALAKLRELDPEGSENLLDNILRSFLDTVPADIESMQAALLRQDGAALRMTAHSIKSSSAYLGALRLSDLCKELELLSQEPRLEAAKTVLAELQAEFARVVPTLRMLIQA